VNFKFSTEEIMIANTSFAELLARLRRREQAAAATVVGRLERLLLHLAQQKLHPGVRSKLGPEDIVQSVFGSIFGRLVNGQFHLEGWDQLRRLLQQATVRRCYRRNAYHLRGRRCANREVSYQEMATAAAETPSAIAMREESIRRALASLPVGSRRAVELFLAGHTVNETAEQLQCSQRTVFRALKEFKSIFGQ
jgi:RNA polymerase sigma factor (sigma-70 family)